jgi:hypothetical protein
MFSLRVDISSGNWICLAQAQICPIKLIYALQKSRSGAKTIRLGPDKLTTCKKDIVEPI